MSKDEVSRRVVLGALSVGAASAAVADSLPLRASPRAAQTADEPAASAAIGTSEALLAPLVPGAKLADWTVEQLLPLQDGAASVVLFDAESRRFQLDICARDPADDACRAPGQSELFEVFLANRGDGDTSTFEAHGLAAMVLADLIRANEQHIDRSGFQTLRQRVETRRARLHVT